MIFTLFWSSTVVGAPLWQLLMSLFSMCWAAILDADYCTRPKIPRAWEANPPCLYPGAHTSSRRTWRRIPSHMAQSIGTRPPGPDQTIDLGNLKALKHEPIHIIYTYPPAFHSIINMPGYHRFKKNNLFKRTVPPTAQQNHKPPHITYVGIYTRNMSTL